MAIALAASCVIAASLAGAKADDEESPSAATIRTALRQVPGQDSPAPSLFPELVQPFFERHCYDCHSGDSAEAGVDLAAVTSQDDIVREPRRWRRVQTMIATGGMPPPDMPRPDPDERSRVARWLEETINAAICSGPQQPPRVTARRLNRLQYVNSVRDLLGVELKVDRLPPDDVGYGFDSVGDVLSLPPLLFEKFLGAAEEAAAACSVPDGIQSGAISQEALAAILSEFMTRAFRRPPRPDETARLSRLLQRLQEEGATPEDAYRSGIVAVLSSPHFLFRLEPDPPDVPPDTVRPLNDFELATRLSYFLWNSTPDAELLELARQNKLRADLREQVDRMLADSKSRSFAHDFAEQWLQLRNLDQFQPDSNRFPGVDDSLKAAMRTEAVLLFETVLRDQLPAIRLLDADFTFVNRRLAEHYGLPGDFDETFQRVSLKNSHRGGVITLAGVLAVTSVPTRTSPVKRGKWIMETILGTPPADPPPGVPLLPDDTEPNVTGTLRERTERHRKDPNCAVCHQVMDPLGFALEHFDAVGRWRDQDGGLPIDASGELPDGRSFRDADDLKQLLAQTSNAEFIGCLTEKLMIYALGRGMTDSDHCWVRQFVASCNTETASIREIILAIVESDAFQKTVTAGSPADPEKQQASTVFRSTTVAGFANR
ncbi:DUF1592 domain-containing protein [Thermopirellula anaerolimosa]